MNFYIHSRESAEDFTKRDITSTYAIISITEPREAIADLPDNRILRLQFHDIDREVTGCKLFAIEDAKEILKFVEKQIAHVNFFIIHCHAGISRSAGVAAALSKIYNQTDEYIFTSGKYMPNMLVYRTILEEYHTNKYS